MSDDYYPLEDAIEYYQTGILAPEYIGYIKENAGVEEVTPVVALAITTQLFFEFVLENY